MGRGLLLRFVAGALVGVMAAVALGFVLRPRIPSTANAGTPVTVTATDGAEIDFQLVDANPTPLEPLPATSTIQLTAFHAAASSPDPNGLPEQPWWNTSIPRIEAITQFDGGPLQAVNCLMAATAMLARLGYGVVTTGSQVRALSEDTADGTTYQNAQAAIKRGWDIRFFQGALTPVQLRAVLWAGAGAIIDGVYGEIPIGVRLQASFTGRHAIYVDGFSPTGYQGGPGYYVMDPIGRTWQGYKGGWWPAADVDRFAAQLPGGRIATMWAFPGGKAPLNRPVLPPEAYPSTGPDRTPGPSASLDVDPFPVDPLPLPPTEPEDGEETGADPPFAEGVEILDGTAEVQPGYDKCLDSRRLFGCPRGIIGIIDLDGLRPPPTKPPLDFDILYGGIIGPGMYQIIYDPPPDSSTRLWFWSDALGTLQEAKVEEGTLGDKTVAVGTITLDPTLDYKFVATAEGDGVRSVSSVGSLEVKQ